MRPGAPKTHRMGGYTMPTQITRRTSLALGVAALAAPAIGQGAFPNRPIRLICPWPAGGVTDTQMRVFAEAVSKHLPQPVVIENRPGASGTLGAIAMRAARPDGYLLTQFPITVFRFPFMQDNPAWNPLTDFTYVAHVTGYLFGVAVRADSDFRTFQDLIAWAKANPGRLSYGTPGVGTTLHITMERIALAARVELLHVPFRGFADNSTALLGGTTMALADSSSWVPLVEAGRMRLLCVWTAERVARFPDVPTLRELGYDIVATSPYGVGGPAGMDPAVVRTLETALLKAIEEPAHLEVLARFDMGKEPMGHAEYTEVVKRMVEIEREFVQRLGLRL
jgi:tripartite-type tricarboxylate transporter receptor subunit TctC